MREKHKALQSEGSTTQANYQGSSKFPQLKPLARTLKLAAQCFPFWSLYRSASESGPKTPTNHAEQLKHTTWAEFWVQDLSRYQPWSCSSTGTPPNTPGSFLSSINELLTAGEEVSKDRFLHEKSTLFVQMSKKFDLKQGGWCLHILDWLFCVKLWK